MTDDLVPQLRKVGDWMRDPTDKDFVFSHNFFDEAADRIKQLEAALEEVYAYVGNQISALGGIKI